MRPKEAKKESILFVYTTLSSFVQTDLEILSITHPTQTYHFAPVKGLAANICEMVKQLFYLLLFGWKYDVMFCWFADYHTLLPVLFARLYRKKSIIVIGGYDVCRIRKLNYGAFNSSFRGFFSASSMRYAHLILPVSQHIARKSAVIAPFTPQKLIYNCVKLENNLSADDPKTKTILTVGLIRNERTFQLKGIDTFIKTARLLPDIRFEIVGISPNLSSLKQETLPPNLSLFDRVEPEELLSFYRNAAIYCQLSHAESFGVSIAEAMTFGAFPIVTNEGGMPEVVGNMGAVVRRNPSTIAAVITFRLNSMEDPGQMAIRARVRDHFSMQVRSQALNQMLESLIHPVE